MAFVLDCSVTMAWHFDDEVNTVEQIAMQALDHTFALVPALWPFEVANTLHVARRRSRSNEAKAAAFLNTLAELDIRVQAVPGYGQMATIYQLAAEQNITGYDASYLELALRTDLPLATLDKTLANRAAALGIQLVG